MERLSAASPEYSLSRSYFDWILALPWRHVSEDRLDAALFRKLLDSGQAGDFYGLLPGTVTPAFLALSVLFGSELGIVNKKVGLVGQFENPFVWTIGKGFRVGDIGQNVVAVVDTVSEGTLRMIELTRRNQDVAYPRVLLDELDEVERAGQFAQGYGKVETSHLTMEHVAETVVRLEGAVYVKLVP